MSVDLFITAGPNRGAYVPMADGKHSVSSHDDADIVLDGVPEQGALVFHVNGAHVRVVPANGAVARVDGRALGRGGANLQPGALVEFGETELRPFFGGVSADDGGAPPGKLSGAARALGLIVVCAGAGLVAHELWGGGLQGGGGVAQNIPPLVEVKESREVAKSPVLQEPIAGGALEGLESRVNSVLRGTGLSGSVKGGRLVITGSVLTAKDEKRLETLLAEVRPYVEVDVSGVRGLGGGNGMVPLAGVQPSASGSPAAPVSTGAEAEPVFSSKTRVVAINIVEKGPAKSYFETQDGARYYEGAIFGAGYVVSAIHPTAVELEKGGRKLEYPLTGR